MRIVPLLATALLLLQSSRPGPVSVVLSEAAGRLRTDVEKRFGQPLKIEREDLPPSILAFSFVDDSGQPVIQVPLSTEPPEADLVHEMFHLRLKADGYASRLEVEAVAPFVRRTFERLSPFIRYQLRDSIQHLAFYDEMKAMGFDPHESYRKDLETKMAAFSFYLNADPAWQTETLAIQYFAAVLEASDEPSIGRLTRVYERNRWDTALRRANELLKIARSERPDTPEVEMAMVIRSLNCVLGRLGTFELDRWETRAKGAFEERNVMLKVTPRSFRTECAF